MSMKMDQKLLWQAWPEGYLAVRGVKTIEMWQCVSEAPLLHVDTALTPWGWPFVGTAKEAHADGGFLPNVDPRDAATWACLLADLAKATGHHVKYPQHYWQRVVSGSRAWWQLSSEIFDMKEEGWVLQRLHTSFPLIDEDDPARAIVLARIQVREKNSA